MSSAPCIFRRLSGMPDIASLNKKKTALLLIEFQNEHFSGHLQIKDAVNIVQPTLKMMNWADKNKIKVVHIKHQAKSISSQIFSPQSTGFEFFTELEPRKNHEVQIKYASSAFSGSFLHTFLQTSGIDVLLLAGMSTASEISATAHDAKQLGYQSIVLADLTATREVQSWDSKQVLSEEKMQETALANIADKYAQVMLSIKVMALPLGK